MSNQEVTINSSVRQPSVSYGAAVRMPDAPLENRVKEPKTDWVNYVLSEGSRAAQGYESIREGGLRLSEQAAKAAKDEEDTRNRNQLAREVTKIAEAQRQGMSQTEAETRLRALRDSYIGILDEKDVNSVIGRHDYGVEDLEQARWKQWQTKDIDRQAKLASDYRASNLYAATLSDAQVLSVVQQMNDSADDLARIQSRKNLYQPGTSEYNRYQALEDAAAESNIYMNVARHMSNLLLNEKNLTPETIQDISNRGVAWAVENGINAAVAQSIIQNTYRRMGVDTLKQNWLDTQKLSIESAENATKLITANAKLQAMSIPEVALYSVIGGEAMEAEITQRLSRSKEFDESMKSVTEKLMKAASKPTIDLSSDMTGSLIQGTNNAYANGEATPYMRGTTALGTLKLVNQNNGVAYTDGEGNVNIALANLTGTQERLNLTAIRRDAKKLQESSDVESNEVGRQLEEEADKLDANKIAAEIMTPVSPLYQTVRGLKDSLNASELRYDEDGKAFLSGTSGVLGSVALAFRGFGGEGSYDKQLKRLNEGLADLSPEIRKGVMERLGIQRAMRGEVSELGERAGNTQPRVIDTGEAGAELYTFSDGTVAKNALRPTQEMASDPITTSIRMSNPSMSVEDDKEKLLAEKRDIINTLKGPEGSKDGLYDVIERLEKNGWKTDVFEQERDALEKRLKEIDIELNGGIQDEESTSVYGGKYDEYLNKYAEEYGQDARLIKKMLMKESSEDPAAVSGKGARGLMQVMPETFKQCVKELGLPDNADPHDPETNIRVGVYYFSKMMKQFDGDVNKALAAYNWGPGNVQKAVEEFGDEWWDGARLIGITVKGKKRKLPKETQKYVSDLGQMYA